MNLRINHDRYETVNNQTTYRIDDIPESMEFFKTYATNHGSSGTLAPELMYRFNEWFMIIISILLMIVAISMEILLTKTGILPTNHRPNHNAYTDYIYGISFFTVIATPLLLLIKYRCDLRYLLFKDNKVILHSKYYGRRIYEAKDLKFHLLKLRQYNHRYHLEVELPDPTLPEDRRLIILETAATKKTMDGVLAVLFPLLRGDTEPSKRAIPRKIEPIPQGEPNSLYRLIDHLENHIHVWFLNYKINQFVFWLVHGSKEKVMQRECKKA